MPKTQISVVTPTFNRIEYLPETVESVRKNITTQNSCDFEYEHLICANGCTDGTAEFLEKVGKEDGSPIRFRVVKEQMLPGPARNLVIKNDASEQSWIAPLDDDDIMLQRNLYYYAYNIQQNPDKQWFINDFVRVDSELRYIGGEDYYHWKFDSPKDMLDAIFRGECFAQGNVCFSKKLFSAVGGYNEEISMAEDLDLYVRFLLAGELPGYSPHISHLHRCHNRNISIGVDPEKHKQDLRMMYERYKEKLQALGVHFTSKTNRD